MRSFVNNMLGKDYRWYLFLPGGHLNNSRLISKYTNKKFEDNIGDGNSACLFIFGGDTVPKEYIGNNIYQQSSAVFNEGIYKELYEKYHVDTVFFENLFVDHGYTIQRINVKNCF